MKNIFLLFSLLLITSTSFSQTHPPRKVKKALEQLAPQAKELSWKGEGERYKIWTAVYMVGSDSMQTKYDSKANWIHTLKYISLDLLPDEVTKSILDNYQGAKITQAAEMQEPNFDGYGVAFMYLKDRWAVAITSEGFVERRQIASEGF